LARPRVDDLKAYLHLSKNVKFGIRRALQFPVTASISHNITVDHWKVIALAEVNSKVKEA